MMFDEHFSSTVMYMFVGMSYLKLKTNSATTKTTELILNISNNKINFKILYTKCLHCFSIA